MSCELYSRPLTDANLERKAQDFERSFEKMFSDSNWNESVISTRLVAEQFLNETLKAPKEQQLALFERAQNLNDVAVCNARPSGLPILNIVFADSTHTGHPDTLAKFNLIQRFEHGRYYGVAFTQELYSR